MSDDRVRRLVTLGREHYAARELEKAERYLAQVVQETEGFPDVWNMLGVIYHAQGRFQLARGAFEAALGQNPGYTEAALNLAVTCNDLGAYAEAREVYMRAIARSTAEPRALDPFARGKLANMHADLGDAYASVAFYPEAVREYQKALELAPAFVDLRTKLASVLRDSGDNNAALRELDLVKTTHPKYVPARLARGTLLFALGQKDEAIREWETVLELAPGDKAAHLYLRMVRDEVTGGGVPEHTLPSDSDIVIEGILDGVEREP